MYKDASREQLIDSIIHDHLKEHGRDFGFLLRSSGTAVMTEQQLRDHADRIYTTVTNTIESFAAEAVSV